MAKFTLLIGTAFLAATTSPTASDAYRISGPATPLSPAVDNYFAFQPGTPSPLSTPTFSEASFLLYDPASSPSFLDHMTPQRLSASTDDIPTRRAKRTSRRTRSDTMLTRDAIRAIDHAVRDFDMSDRRLSIEAQDMAELDARQAVLDAVHGHFTREPEHRPIVPLPEPVYDRAFLAPPPQTWRAPRSQAPLALPTTKLSAVPKSRAFSKAKKGGAPSPKLSLTV